MGESDMEGLVTALPKGRLLKPVVEVLKQAELISGEQTIDTISRKLVFRDQTSQNSFLLAKPKDVPAYIEHGAADVGITGKDVIGEHGKRLYELFDLEIGSCQLVVAVPEETGIQKLEDIPEHSRVATSYPRLTKDFFRKAGIQVEVIYLHGSVELAPLVELADIIVDITSTGTTLRKNNLVPIAEVFSSSARLVVNNVSYKTRYREIEQLLEAVEAIYGGNNHE
ncbi:MAG: ATP phosphoribosyltransferase [Bacillota bacterium]